MAGGPQAAIDSGRDGRDVEVSASCSARPSHDSSQSNTAAFGERQSWLFGFSEEGLRGGAEWVAVKVSLETDRWADQVVSGQDFVGLETFFHQSNLAGAAAELLTPGNLSA